MSEFFIGFEFEFGWLPKDFPMKKPKSKPTYFDQNILPEVKYLLDSQFPDIALEIKEDCTLKFLSSKEINQGKKYWQTYYGVEVVTLPMREVEALDFLDKFLNWLNSQDNIQINQSCSLHLNINFTSQAINQNIDYWKLLDIYPQEHSLNLFSRQKNEYCQNSHTIKFGFEENGFISKSRTLSHWREKINKWKNKNSLRNLKMVKKSFGSEFYEISKQEKLTQKLITPIESMESVVLQLFKKRINGMLKNVSIVQKNKDTNPYFEFRMIGNIDYHKRHSDILDTLQLSKASLLKSLV